MVSAPTPILFLGAPGPSPGEAMVAAAHRAIALDILEKAAQAGMGQPILATNWEELARDLEGRGRVLLDSSPFHFGQRLRQVVLQFQLQRPVYLARGYGVLLPTSTLASIGTRLRRSQNMAITNNYYSSDMVAFTPGQALTHVEPPANDNSLARLLNEQAGLRVIALPRSAATLFDVDSPTDLYVLRLHPGLGPHTRACLESLELEEERLAPFLKLLSDPGAEVVVAGRVSSFTWRQLETVAACRIRVLSEERGMRADGREASGEAHSILGFHLAQVGPSQFFRDLAQLGQGAFLDTRVLFAHLGLRPSQADRFHSDLGWPHLIQDPWLQKFTRAALEAPIPVLLGGHSLVSGGLLALLEALELAGKARPALTFPLIRQATGGSATPTSPSKEAD